MTAFLADLADLEALLADLVADLHRCVADLADLFSYKVKKQCRSIGRARSWGRRLSRCGVIKEVYREKRSAGLPGLPLHVYGRAPRSATMSAKSSLGLPGLPGLPVGVRS